MFNNQELINLVIIFFILMTSMRHSGVILKEENRYWSLLEIKVLKKSYYTSQIFSPAKIKHPAVQIVRVCSQINNLGKDKFLEIKDCCIISKNNPKRVQTKIIFWDLKLSENLVSVSGATHCILANQRMSVKQNIQSSFRT